MARSAGVVIVVHFFHFFYYNLFGRYLIRIGGTCVQSEEQKKVRRLKR